MMNKLEDFLLSEKALDVQISLFLSYILIGLLNIFMFDSSIFGAIILIIIFLTMTIDILLTVLVVIINVIMNEKGGK